MQQIQSGRRFSGNPGKGPETTPDMPRAPFSLKTLGWRLLGLAFIDAVAIWFAVRLITDGAWLAAGILLLVTLLVNWIFLSEKLYPLRWITPGFLLLLLMVVYPLVYTIYVSTTNYGDGHRLTKEQVLGQLQSQVYQPQGAASYNWTAYRNPAGDFRVVLQGRDGGQTFIADKTGTQPFTAPQTLPDNLDGNFRKLSPFEATAAESALRDLNLKRGDFNIQLTNATLAQEVASRYTYNAGNDTLTDRETNVVYTAKNGIFTAQDGRELYPGFVSSVGANNYSKVFTSPDITGPFFGVFIWTLAFAFFSVLFTFSLGLLFALVLNDRDLPFRPLWRTLMIIPYTIPAFISVLVWAGLFNIDGPMGAIGRTLFGNSFTWLSDPNGAKFALLLVNTWLGFPYMMLICLGALQSIPTDMYEAASIDGASMLQKFWRLTLPLLMVSVAPLLVGAFAFNFNNFTVIELLTRGGPPNPEAATPAGQTDILISYTYRLAFASGRGSDLGLAATISLFIFVIVAAITIVNFQFTKRLEGVLK